MQNLALDEPNVDAFDDTHAVWDDIDPDFDSDPNNEWSDVELNEDGQQLIPIQQAPELTLAEVLQSIHLPPDTNLDNVPEDVLSKLVEKMPSQIFDKLEQKYGNKMDVEIEETKKQNYRHKLPHIYSIKHITQLIKQCSNIVILCGAGISTAANIPDFRSHEGLYHQLNQNDAVNKQTNDASDIFDLQFFLKEGPQLFYSHGTEKLFSQTPHTPTKTHYFMKTLEHKNKLLRIHTQNIDGLELKTGISSDKINHCHGTTSSYSCVNCMWTVQTTSGFIRQHVKSKSIPYCIKCCNINMDAMALNQEDIISNGIHICKEEKDEFTNVLRIRIPSLLIPELERNTNILKMYRLSLEYSLHPDETHHMHHVLELRHDDDDVLEDLKSQIMRWLKSFASYGALKPNTIFFNESLNQQCLDLIASDVTHCDLVFVIGTSMLVDPFGSIPNLLNKDIPLVLINRQVVGRSQYEFDVHLLGDCDDICQHLLQ
eukprot:710787_1